MDRKAKLAQAILIEAESLEIAKTNSGVVTLALLIINDAKELAKLIEKENKEAA